jgi:hypothetical protein
MSEASQLTEPRNVYGEAVDLKKGIYFIQFSWNEKTTWLDLQKEHLLYNAKYDELLELKKVIESKLRELTSIKNKIQVQVDQILVIQAYLPKLNIRLSELELTGSNDDFDESAEFIPIKQRVLAIASQFSNYFTKPKP